MQTKILLVIWNWILKNFPKYQGVVERQTLFFLERIWYKCQRALDISQQESRGREGKGRGKRWYLKYIRRNIYEYDNNWTSQEIPHEIY